MQRILSIDKGKIISKPWDFEAMCLVDDNKDGGEIKKTLPALYYLFEGSKATNEVINKLPAEKLMTLCREIWSWYVTDIAEAMKNQPNASAAQPAASLRSIYGSMFKAWGRLPDEIGRQRPKDIFMLLSDEEPVNMNELPQEIKEMYGL